MSKCKRKKLANKAELQAKAGTFVTVDVTKIVKYFMLAGIIIVAIIFGTDAYIKKLEHEKETKED